MVNITLLKHRCNRSDLLKTIEDYESGIKNESIKEILQEAKLLDYQVFMEKDLSKKLYFRRCSYLVWTVYGLYNWSDDAVNAFINAIDDE